METWFKFNELEYVIIVIANTRLLLSSQNCIVIGICIVKVIMGIILLKDQFKMVLQMQCRVDVILKARKDLLIRIKSQS